jgi:hypothetical protein
LTRAPKMRSTSMEPQRFRNWLPLQGINSVAFYSAFSWRFENRWTRACAILFSL